MLIVGGGVGGMACAISLRRAGMEVDLVEIDPSWKTYGAGITMTGPTLRALKTLGVFEEVKAQGATWNGLYVFTRAGQRIQVSRGSPRVVSSQQHAALDDEVIGIGRLAEPRQPAQAQEPIGSRRLIDPAEGQGRSEIDMLRFHRGELLPQRVVPDRLIEPGIDGDDDIGLPAEDLLRPGAVRN